MPCYFFEGHAVQQKLSTVDSWRRSNLQKPTSKEPRKHQVQQIPRFFAGVGDPKMIQYDSYDHETIGIVIRNQNYIDNDDQPSDSWGFAFLKLRS